MKSPHLTTAVVLLLLALPGQASAQSAADRASLESYRWGVVAAHESVEPAREWLDDAMSRRVAVVESREVEKARDKVAEEKSRIERGDRDRTDDLARAEAELSFAEGHVTVTEARIVAAQSALSTREATIVSAEAVFVAAETATSSGEEATLLTAHIALMEAANIAGTEYAAILKIDVEGPVRFDRRFHNDSPSAVQVSIVWGTAARAARAADRAEAIVEALSDGEALPPELLEPLPTEFGPVA